MLVDSLSDEDNANSLRGGLDVYSMPQKRCMYAEQKLRLTNTNNVIVLQSLVCFSGTGGGIFKAFR